MRQSRDKAIIVESWRKIEANTLPCPHLAKPKSLRPSFSRANRSPVRILSEKANEDHRDSGSWISHVRGLRN